MATLSTANGAPTATTSTNEAPPIETTTIVAPSGDKHTHTFIFLHGREDFGSYMAKDLFDNKSSDGRTLAEIFPSIRWVFPAAKLRYSEKRAYELSISSFAKAAEGGQMISQWFDVWDVRDPELKKELSIPGLQESIKFVLGIIKDEARRAPLERIILGGVSQGCATAILTLLSSRLDLGGFIGWCGWLPFQRDIENLSRTCINDKSEISRHIQTILQISTNENVIPGASSKDVETDTKSEGEFAITRKEIDTVLSSQDAGYQSVIKTSVFLAHSKDDETVPFKLGDDLRQIVKRLGFGVTWEKYENGGNWIHEEHGVDEMSSFLQRIVDI